MLVQGKTFWKYKETGREESGLKHEGVEDVLAVEIGSKEKEASVIHLRTSGVGGGGALFSPLPLLLTYLSI